MKDGCSDKKTGNKPRKELPVLPNAKASSASIRSSGAAWWRAGALITLNVLMIVHFIQWRMTGETISPIEPSEAMETLQTGAVNAGFIFFVLAITATLIFGRFVCGWACHIVALQDFSAWLLEKAGIRPRPFRSRLLIYVPLAFALYMFVWPTVLRFFAKAPSEPLFPYFTNHIITTDFWATFPPFWVAVPFLFVCGFVTVYFLGMKGFCTYGCPYGGFFGIADKVAPGRIRVTDACNECGHCTATCTSNVLVHSEVKKYGMVVDPGCMKCMDCVSVCPNDALYFGFGKPAIAVKKEGGRNYSLTWLEEIGLMAIFILSLFAVWDVYQLVPMLMAIGIAIVSAFVGWKAYRILSTPDTSFGRTALRVKAKTTTAGWGFLAFALVWFAFISHSGWVRYHERRGAIAFESVQIPDELALADADPTQWLSTTDKENVANGSKHFHNAFDLGLFTNRQAIAKFAWLEYLNGDTDRALDLLADAASHETGTQRALNLYYRGAILNRLGRADEASVDLKAALTERPDLAAASEELGEAEWRKGERDDAIRIWRDVANKNAGRPLASTFLAAALPADSPDARLYSEMAGKVTPNDPYFHWMLGLRLQNLGLNQAAERHFAQAAKLNPAFQLRRKR